MRSQRAILVLGSGRSGTSMLTRALQVSGVYLGERFKRASRKNPRGFFEEVHLLRLIKKVRRELGLRPESVRLIEEAEWRGPGIEGLKTRAAKVIRSQFSGHPVWGFKYGGNGRLLPFWLELLPAMDIESAFVFAYRNPLSVARSRSELDRSRGDKADLEWLVNVVPYFRRLRRCPLVAVDYDRLVDDPAGQVQRMANRLELPLDAGTRTQIESFADEFVCNNLRHTRFGDTDLENDARIHPLVRRAALLLSRLSGDELSADDDALWDEWRLVEEELQSLAPLLRLVDSLQADLRRGRWWDVITPLRNAWKTIPLLRPR